MNILERTLCDQYILVNSKLRKIDFIAKPQSDLNAY